ncbi:dihydrolipoyl dehydrogenase family protein [Alienimonas californiensis]|uniref:Glutathione amide reductase n=1 Tax=Alienimonas californiensis TaxID=2527989 RepID=A0A517PCI7_9PLAN|nr:NAD(P)/FAD-dependent oxidoreductase [Alienimonas californiensis]QDT17085.1 Glutathione amide reductase [Alienimonas californiensis]
MPAAPPSSPDLASDPLRYDVVVIGSGPAAGMVVSGLKGSGKRVAAVDRRRFGGTCALRGCSPKKVLLNAAKAVDFARRADGVLVSGGARVGLDWPRLHAFQESFTEPVPPSRLEQFRDAGADCYAGAARFTGPDSLAVEGEQGNGAVTLRFDQVAIAVGSVPAPLDVPGEELLIHSDEFLAAADMPARVVIVGGGYIGLEFAHALLRADRQVTIVETGRHLLSPFDSHLADRLAERTRGLGARFECRAKLTGIERVADGSLAATAEREDGELLRFLCDAVLHAAGRVPAVKALDCDAAGIDWDEKGIAVTERLVSVSHPRAFAAGDCVGLGHPMLTPVAEAHGKAVLRTLLTGDPTAPDVSPLPSATFTEPEMAAVGLTVEQADEQGVAYRLIEADLGTKGTFRKLCEPCVGYRMLLEPKGGRLLGVHLLGPGMAELINLFAVALRHDLTLSDLAAIPLAFPTVAKEVVEDAAGKA